MDRLGVTPTIQTSKNFEGIARIEEIADTDNDPHWNKETSTFNINEHPGYSDDDEPESPILGKHTNLIGPQRRVPTPPPVAGPSRLADRMDLSDDEVSFGSSGAGSPPRSITPMRSENPGDEQSFEDRYDPGVGRSITPMRSHQLCDHNTDWQVFNHSLETGHSLIDPFLGSNLDLENIGRSLDRVHISITTTCFQIHRISCTDCANCKTSQKFDEWIMDSGASIHFTGKESDFSDLQMFPIDKRPPVSTANGQASVHGHGTIFVENSVTQNGKSKTHVTRFHPVYFMPGVSVRLMSMGQLLKGNMRVQGDEKSLTFLSKGNNAVMLRAAPKLLQSDTIYWVDSKIVSGGDLIAHQSVHRDDYELWHRRLGHPSHQVLEKLGNNTNNFPSKL